jgi:tetratricopeptide (TPR) repeat protein
MLKLQLQLTRRLALMAALAAGWMLCGLPSRALVVWNGGATSQTHQGTTSDCPPPGDLDAALGKASDLMEKSNFQAAAALLQPLLTHDCDVRASLLLAAAFDGLGDGTEATEVLRRAHSVWPSNNSVAASLARKFLAAGEKEQAVRALAHFRGTAETPEQELEMAVVVYMATQQLVPAETIAEVDYKYHPSLHSLLLVANALQLQGRYPDVNRLLGSKRATYSDSPEFLITLAESESDASIFPPARADLQRAISLNPNLYQAHYILGNVLARQNDPDGAIAEYRKAINLSPEQPRTYYQLALVLRSKLDDSGEQQALEKALAADDRYAPAHCEIGRILLQDDRPAEAVSHLLSAIQDNPRDEKAYFLLARAYARLGEKDKANQIVKRLQAVRKENRPGPPGNGQSASSAN